MASDEVVWQIVGQQFCSYKLKTTKEQSFCRNEYNVTGFCSRQACPLANSRYATVRADPNTGVLYLYMKTIERAHMPSKLWERIKLSENYEAALAQLDTRLIYWPKFLIYKCKQRLTRLRQVAIRTRRLAKEEMRLGEKIVPKLAPKVRRREATRERKAEAAAKVEREIERTLIDRLKSGVYGEQPLNVEEGIWKKVLKGLERQGEGVRDEDEDEDEDEELVDELEELDVEGKENRVGDVEYVSDLDESSEEDLEDWLSGDSSDEDDDEEDESEDSDESEEDDAGEGKLKRKRAGKAPLKAQKKTKLKKTRARPQIEIEYDTEPPQPQEVIHV